ncbi:MAG: SCO family protein [Pseudomonadota bacterium]|nr:SCO family protein [Pseudomonadota bacterium]
MKRVRILIWILVVLALAGFAYLTLRPTPEGRVSQGQVTGSTFGGPFTLLGSDSKPFSSQSLSGKPFAVFFGFTHCPDVCPTTLQRLVKLRNELGRGDEAFNIVFVSVDPERDGPEQVATYENAFGGPVIALTGSPAQIEQVKKQFGIFAQKAPDGNGGYNVDHTATALLFDRNGQFVSTISPEEPDQPALDKLKRVTA